MEYAIGWNRLNLTVLGVWPEPRRTTRHWRAIKSFVYWSSTVVTICFISMPQTGSLILECKNLDEIIENLSINIPIAFAVIKQGTLRYYGKDIGVLRLHFSILFISLTLYGVTFNTFPLVGLYNNDTLSRPEMLKDWSRSLPDSERKLMLKNARISHGISIFCSTLTCAMVSAFLSLQIYNNVALGGLILPASFPYDLDKSPNFEITFSGQLAGAILTGICYSSFDAFLAVLVLHLCGQLAVLRLKLRELAQNTRENATAFEQRIGYIIDKHEQLYRYAITVENCFNLVLLAQTLISTSMFCLTGYRMITSMDQEQNDASTIGMIFFIVHVVYTMLHLFIHCYVGETLLVESTEIGQSTYESEWYDLSPKQVVCLTIVLCRARVPFQITAGKFSPFSLEFFGAIMKTSAGYLSVLLAMKDRLAE